MRRAVLATLSAAFLAASGAASAASPAEWEFRRRVSAGEVFNTAILATETWDLVATCDVQGRYVVGVSPGAQQIDGYGHKSAASRFDNGPWVQQAWMFDDGTIRLEGAAAKAFVQGLRRARQVEIRAGGVSLSAPLGASNKALTHLAALCSTSPPSTQPSELSPRALGPDLWQGARQGMSEDEVLKIFPNARRRPPGSFTQLEVSTQIVGRPATARFEFSINLQRVYVEVLDVPTLAEGEKLRDIMMVEFGPPLKPCRRIPPPEGIPAGGSTDCDWARGDVDVHFSYARGATVIFERRVSAP